MQSHLLVFNVLNKVALQLWQLVAAVPVQVRQVAWQAAHNYTVAEV